MDSSLQPLPLSPDDERAIRAARETGVFCVLSRTAVVEVRGADAGRYLEAMCTKDLSGLDPGGLRYAALLDDLAHYVADFWIWRVGESWWLETESALARPLAERLTRFAVADDATADVLESKHLFHLEGPGAWTAATQILGSGMSADAVGSGAPGTSVTAWARRSRFGQEGVSLVAEGPAPVRWIEATRAAGLVPASFAAQECLRIEAGRVRGGVDMTAKHLLPEIGLWGAVSLDKGCFPGQEIVRRVISRGEVKRRLVGFVESPNPEAQTVTGTLFPATSIARSARMGGRVGLGYANAGDAVGSWSLIADIDRKESNPDLFLAQVAALPFVSGPHAAAPDVPGERVENSASR